MLQKKTCLPESTNSQQKILIFTINLCIGGTSNQKKKNGEKNLRYLFPSSENIGTILEEFIQRSKKVS